MTPWKDLLERQQRLVCRVQAAQCALRMEREEFGKYSENLAEDKEGESDGEERKCIGNDGASVCPVSNEKEWQNTIKRVMKRREHSIEGHKEKQKAMKRLSLCFDHAVSQYFETMSPSSPEAKPLAAHTQN